MQINVHEAKTQLSKLLEKLSSGAESEIIIAKAGKPVAKLIPFAPNSPHRTLGTLASNGNYWESDDCWEPDEELISQASDGSVFPTENSQEVPLPSPILLAEDPKDFSDKDKSP